MVARYSASDSNDHYFCESFLFFSPSPDFRHFQPTFTKLCHMTSLGFQQNICYRASHKVPLKQMRGQTTKFRRFSGRSSAGKKIENLTQYCQSLTIVVHVDTNLAVVGPQTTEIDALVYTRGGKILRLLANAALYLGNGTRYSYYGEFIRNYKR